MKNRKPSKRGASGRNKTSTREPFFIDGNESKKKRRYGDDDIDSVDSEDDMNGMMIDGDISHDDEAGEVEARDEWAEETADERRYRLAKKIVSEVSEKMRREREEEEDDESEREGERKYDKTGERDTFVANKLLQDQLEESGRLRRAIASRVQKPGDVEGFKTLVKHRQSVTSVCLSDDDLKGFSASKDGTIVHWDVDSGKGERYQWPNDETLKSHGFKDPGSRVMKHSRSVLALAVSTDGRYLVTGGLDRHVHLWDTRTQEHVQSFPGHRGSISCLSFRQGTSEVFSGSFDRSIKIWNVEDRAYINTLFGHQSEVLTIDCLRKERVLGVGRDRTMQLFKVPEESRLVFRASLSSLECGCFINNDEFLSGSDAGNIELWCVQKKKPVYVVKNAHTMLDDLNNVQQKQNGTAANGDLGSHGYSSANSWVSSVTVCRGSDLAATGAGNGTVRLWAVESDQKIIRPLYDLPLVGFVNSLAFSKSGDLLVAGVGKEPRLGRWGRIPDAQNGIAIQRLKLS